MKYKLSIAIALILIFYSNRLYCQQTDTALTLKTSSGKKYKNVVRYNLSGPLLFGFDKYVIFGYERVVNARQSFSINIGGVGLPSLVSLNTDSFYLQKDVKNTGYNISVDYRFYLSKENKYAPPHGIYIGPYISYNHFIRENKWTYQRPGSANEPITANTRLNIFTVGAELGYQFVFWKRLTLDLVLVGPGLANYDIKATVGGNLSDAERENLQDILKQAISQKFPGMNYVLSDKEFNANGTIGALSIGYRYLISVGFRF
jgi:hypothetical protein